MSEQPEQKTKGAGELTPQKVQEAKEKRENRKSWVRVIVTYVAAGFIFIGGGSLIVIFSLKGKEDEAMNVFNIILPIAAGIVTYWFATRSNQKTNKDN